MQENDNIDIEKTSSDDIPNENKASINTSFQEIIAFFRDIIIIVIIVLFIRTYFVAPFQISGESMEASYHDKEFILVNKFSYADFGVFYVSNPMRGDVVILRPHAANGKEYYIKRVVGMPGDTIKFQEGEVFIKNIKNTEFIKLDEGYLGVNNKGKTFLPSGMEEQEFTIPEGAYFTMGDNRNNSSDSRSCFMSCSISQSSHFIDRENIIGKLFIDFGYKNIFYRNNPNVPKSWPMRLLNTPKDWIYKELQ